MSSSASTSADNRLLHPAAVPRWQWIASAAVPVLLLLPFINKPFHIDDTAYVAIAKHIVQHPFDYYGFSYNWSYTSFPVYEWHRSPPLGNYYLALLGFCFGWHEWILHFGLLLPAALVGVGTLALARRLCKRPDVALFATLCSPALVVTGTGLMLDTWLLAFFIIAIGCLVEGFARRQLRWFLLAGLCAGLSAWTKYFGAALIPLFFAYAWFHEDRPRYWWLCLLIPAVMIGIEQGYSHSLYGQLLIGSSAQSVASERPDRPLWLWAIVTFAFCGGTTFSVMQVGAVLWKGRYKLIGLIIIAALAFTLYQLNARGMRLLTLGFDMPVISLILYAIFILGGTQIFSLSVTDLQNRREPESWLLALWVAGTFFFTAFLSWSVNVRTVLPLLPAVAILAARRLDYIPIPDPKRADRRIVIALVISTLIAMGLSRSDLKWAQSQKQAAQKCSELALNYDGNVYFEGHWGFQYYMTEAGVRQFDYENTRVEPGDMIICPQNNSNVIPVPAEYVAKKFVDTFPIGVRMATMSTPLGAGFYTDLWGPLPFALGEQMPPDNYYFYVIGKSGYPYESLVPN